MNRTFRVGKLLAGFLTAVSLATPVATQATPFSGPFVGVNAGGIVSVNKYYSNLHSINNFPAATIYENQFRLTDASATGGVDLGYDFRVGANLIFGIEVFYNFQKSTMSKTINKLQQNADFAVNDTFVATFHANDVLSPALRLGVAGNDAMAYFNLGIPFSRFTTNTVFTSVSTDFIVPANSLTVTSSARNSQYQTGYLLGVGVERYLTDSVTAFINYRYNRFRKVSQQQTEISIRSLEVANNIQEHMLLVGVNKRFDV